MGPCVRMYVCTFLRVQSSDAVLKGMSACILVSRAGLHMHMQAVGKDFVDCALHHNLHM